jgi:drug/metabolite transporter (DMT)-like permease
MTGALTGSAGAISLAVVAAVCFAGAAVLQHGAVSAESAPHESGDSQTLTLRGLRAVARQPGWLTGLVLAGSGTALHAVALILAPLSVVQPIGVLAVPIAVLLTAQRSRRAPGARVVGWVAMSVLGVAAFVVTAAGTAVTSQPQTGAPLVAAAVVAGVVVVLAVVGLAQSGWVRCVACATAGAVAFGLVSGLVRAVSQSIAPGLRGLLDPSVVVVVVVIGAAVVVGGWLVQQAFASGPPEVVVACLTVVDPIVAVVLGAVLLGEGAATPPAFLLVLVAAAAVAAVGVVGLAKHHPDAASRVVHEAPGAATRRSVGRVERSEHSLRR